MYKRLPMLALFVAATALGTSACGASGSTAAAPSASASASPSPAQSSAAAPAATPAEARQLTGLLRASYLRTIRTNYSDLDGISDDLLVEHGNAFCAAHGQALADQAKKTTKELGITPKETVKILGTAHGVCR
ncbi:hypothetical protein ACH427_22475 [Streptomyces sp. NPDC020379]|uniref:hypothetical protein n=1 Tax=Streptomyces sp. NPDC020379 TaxID=3365071 RepID=UPI0037980240